MKSGGMCGGGTWAAEMRRPSPRGIGKREWAGRTPALLSFGDWRKMRDQPRIAGRRLRGLYFRRLPTRMLRNRAGRGGRRLDLGTGADHLWRVRRAETQAGAGEDHRRIKTASSSVPRGDGATISLKSAASATTLWGGPSGLPQITCQSPACCSRDPSAPRPARVPHQGSHFRAPERL